LQQSEAYAYFFRVRWPHGFVCPRCSHFAYFMITSRAAPLYQCRRCRHQTSLTAGTAMERSRTSLAIWAQALDALSKTHGLNAVQLSKQIGVSHKTAWTMLRRIREAIGRAELDSKLRGRTYLGLMFLGTRNLQPFVSHPQEHAVLLGSNIDHATGAPAVLKMLVVPPERLVRKQVVQDAVSSFVETHVHSESEEVVLLRRFALTIFSPLRKCFLRASAWLNTLFHGLGRKYLQSYLNEFCFRYNVESQGASLRDSLISVCLGKV